MNGKDNKKHTYYYILILLFMVLILGICGCGSSQIGDIPYEEIDEACLGERESERLVETYNFFLDWYYDFDLVRYPFSCELAANYVNSYKNMDDIYTEYFGYGENPLKLTLNDLDEIRLGITDSNETIVTKTYDQGVLYLAFDKFVFGTAGRVIEKIDNYITQGYSKLILDLRINGGGLPDECAYLLAYFVRNNINNPSNTILLTIEFSRETEHYYLSDYYTFDYETTFDNTNMYILTSGLTASASEVLVAGLDYFNESTQIGSTTFGKNRAITSYLYDENDGFIITVGIAYHADGVDREGIGISPVYNTEEPYEQLNNLLDINENDPLQGDWDLPDSVMEHLYDKDYWRDKQLHGYNNLFFMPF